MKAISQSHEHEWLPDLISGDESAFELFFESYHGKVFNFSNQYLKNRQLAEDLTQDVFIKIWQEKSKLKEVENLDAYLFQIARRKTIDCLRQITRDRKVHSNLKENGETACYPIQDLENTKFLEKLKKGLSPQQLAVFELSRERGLTYEMIAGELNISKNTVRNHMVEALRYLKKMLSKPFFILISIFIFSN